MKRAATTAALLMMMVSPMSISADRLLGKKERRGLGRVHRIELVKRNLLLRIAAAWVITVPLAAILAAPPPLSLPVSTVGGEVSLIDALFTSTSAVSRQASGSTTPPWRT